MESNNILYNKDHDSQLMFLFTSESEAACCYYDGHCSGDVKTEATLKYYCYSDLSEKVKEAESRGKSIIFDRMNNNFQALPKMEALSLIEKQISQSNLELVKDAHLTYLQSMQIMQKVMSDSHTKYLETVDFLKNKSKVAHYPGIVSLTETNNIKHRVVVNELSFPHLIDHEVNGKIVLPIVHVIEWFVSLAKTDNLISTDKAVVVDDFKVFSGVIIDDFSVENYFNISLSQDVSSINAELKDESGRIRYAAKIMNFKENDSFDDRSATTKSLSPWPIQTISTYKPGYLFHGPSFQTINELISISSDGAIVKLDANIDSDWLGSPWETSPGLLDGCFQIPAIWGVCNRKQMSLPTSFDKIIFFNKKPRGILTCKAYINLTQFYTESDVCVYDKTGNPVILIQGLKGYFINSK